MNSSASTANSTDEAARGPDDVDDEGAGEVVPSSPFDRLPDEVVVEILRQAMPSTYWDVPLDSMIVNKRIFALFQPLRFSRFYFSELSNAILARPKEIGTVAHLEYWASPSHPQVVVDECRMLDVFRNLTSLTVKLLPDVLAHEAPEEAAHATSYSFGVEDGPLEEHIREYGFPLTFTESLKQLKHLEYLYLRPRSEYKLEDSTFSIARDLPQLRRLVLDEPSSSLHQLLTPSPCLSHLRLFRFDAMDFTTSSREDLPLDLLPWSILVSLSIDLGSFGDWQPALAKLVASLEDALFPSVPIDWPGKLPLRRLHLYDPLVDESQPRSSGLSAVDIRRLFELLAVTGTEEVGFDLSIALHYPDELPALPSVKVLRISARDERAMEQPDHVAAFSIFLRSAPALEYLELHGVLFSASYPKTGVAPVSLDMLFQYSPLFDLLAAIRPSTILSVAWNPPYANHAYRWIRSAADEDFEVDWYRRLQEEEKADEGEDEDEEDEEDEKDEE
ncbi:hypothetical protein JCM8097_009039 [Rhodosporidiobolus ruineniae]